MPLDTFVLLCTRQTQLRTIWIGETEDSVTNSVVARRALSKAFSSIKNLDILPVSHNTAETGEMILRTATCLRSLRLDLRRNAVASTHRFTSNPFYDREDVLHILFGEISTLSPPICLSLTTLELLEINLYASASTIIAANDFSTLKRLVIYQCEHTELFLDALIEKRKRRETSLGNLKEFLFRVEQSEQNTKALESFERFLHQVKGLRTLSARFDGAPRFPKIGCITPHGPTLEVLCIDVTDSYGVARDRYAHQDIGFLCSHLTAVTQLGLCLPVLKVDPVESQAFVKESLNHIFSLPHLTLLNILNLPSTNWSTVVDEARVLAEHVAGLVFAHERNLCRRRPTAGLRALVLGDVADDAAAVAAPARSEYLEVAFYVPMEVCWPTGPRRKKVVAAGLAWEEWRKVVGDTRVLELGGY
ncbi:MAG: hypothetical protein M1833_002083 [Piccolia ochrophora]|nr:MAG: hypothetical protein M1833_002083 [Piccolia ochrophora]